MHPENSIASFESAIAAGADGIETDVRLTRDGVPVLFHDRDFARRRPVARASHAEISRTVGFDVPTLEEALERFDVVWDVEIKSFDAVAPAIRVLRRFKGRRRFFVTSFQPAIVVRATRALGVEGGRIFARGVLRGRRQPGSMVVIRLPLASRLRVALLKKKGRTIYVYGAKTAAEHARVRSLAVEGVITDWPQRALARELE